MRPSLVCNRNCPHNPDNETSDSNWDNVTDYLNHHVGRL